MRHIIDAWLEQDQWARRKQHHTAQRIYERLREEYHFKGHPSTVRAYVASVRHRKREVFMPLALEPGEEAQVDWHEGYIIENGIELAVQFFCMRFSYSKASFVWPYLRATLEAFLDGHVRAFAYFGGIPHRLALEYVIGHILWGLAIFKGASRLFLRVLALLSTSLLDPEFGQISNFHEDPSHSPVIGHLDFG